MTLYLIGLGLFDEKDISVKGLEAVKNCDYLFLEDYTSKLNIGAEVLERFYGKKILLANRDLVEKRAEEILEKARDKNIGFLVVGDVFSATTHVDLYMRAKSLKLDIKIIHSASVLNAVGIIGLELYKYGQTTSLPYFQKNFRPNTPFNVITQNLSRGLHTLILLDIDTLNNRYMTISQAIEQLFYIANKKKDTLLSNKKIVGCARLGGDNIIKYGPAKELQTFDFGPPLHCIIIPGKLHFMEEEMLKLWL